MIAGCPDFQSLEMSATAAKTAMSLYFSHCSVGPGVQRGGGVIYTV